MDISGAIGNLSKGIFIAACIYGLVTWQTAERQDGDEQSFAKQACIDGVRARYDATRVRANTVEQSADGFVVETSITLQRGTTANVHCDTNPHGGVTDIYIDKR